MVVEYMAPSWVLMVTAFLAWSFTFGAAGQVVKGDKEDPESAALYNEGYILDLAEVGGDEETGADVLYEFKVPSPLTKSHVVTGKSPKHGGVPASVGHLYAFGNTEEKEVPPQRPRVQGARPTPRRLLRPQDRSRLGQGGKGGLLRRDRAQRLARGPHDHRDDGRHCPA